jgi:predicted  nucleic acid-binding Zn-ribbon protein
MLGDVIADKIISTTDPQEAAKYRAMYSGQLNALGEGPFAPLNADQVQNKWQQWENKVTLKRANVQIRDNPTAFLVDLAAGKYPEFDEDTAGKLGKKARDQLDDMEKITERNTKKIREEVEKDWSAKANFGQLGPELDDALAGKHPYISPDRARVLKGINENPPTGNGNQAAMTTWSQYLSSGRDLQRIQKTRAELNRIQADIGAPNKYIMDRLNELQNDQTTMENQGISRQANDIAAQNRGIANEINQYRADKTPVPAYVERLRPNTTAQDEAKIKAIYQKDGAEAAQKLREKLSKGAVSTYEKTPTKMKNVQDYGE